jgi:hypothetical protein
VHVPTLMVRSEEKFRDIVRDFFLIYAASFRKNIPTPGSGRRTD